MARRKKRRQRLRLLRWVVPLFDGTPIPDEHVDGCRCPRCEADLYLAAEDVPVLQFYGHVWDQFMNHTPFGTSDGKPPWIAPNLLAWLSACDLLGVPEADRTALISLARVVLGGCHGAIREYGIAHIAPEDLAPPEEIAA